MRPADDALVVLFQAAEPSLDLVAFAQFVFLGAGVAFAARLDWFDVFGLQPSVPVPVFVPVCETRCLGTDGVDDNLDCLPDAVPGLTSIVPSE